MAEYSKLTKKQLEDEMETFRKVFSVVRVLSKDEIPVDGKAKDTGHGNCFDFWKRGCPCENCISSRALAEKTQKTKLEFCEDDIYQVVSQYVEVDGEPCVVELIKSFKEESTIDLGNGKEFAAKLSDYFEKTYTDVLTGAYNRRYYEEKLRTLEKDGGVAMMDVDDFKIYNDLFGHGAGDEVLDEVAREIKRHIRKTDKFVRYGGDEFLLYMPNIKREHFAKRIADIRESVDALRLQSNNAINPSLSIGAVMISGETVEDGVRKADELLYLAKREKNVVVTDGAQAVSSKERAKVLIVDDAKINRDILFSILQNEYDVIESDGGDDCIEKIKAYGSEISLILLDLIMPKTDGFAVLEFMSRNRYIDEIPVITITGDESGESMLKAYEMGVSDYIQRPFDAKVVYRRVSNTINIYAKQKRLVSAVVEEMTEKEKNGKLLVEILSQIVEFGGKSSGSHVKNMGKLTELLLNALVLKTRKYALTKRDIYLISIAAAVHDIGKYEISADIINKPGKLTDEEYEIMKKHTVYGAKMIESLKEYQEEPLLKYAYEIARWHHERYDGSGYPDGLKGDEIPISAQAVSICDVYDALRSKRPYKDAFSHEKAVDMIVSGECGAFNPLLIECFKEISADIKDI